MPSSTWRERFLESVRTQPQQVMFGAGVLLVLATGIAAVLMFFRVAESSRWVAHTLEVRAAAGDVLSDMQDAETGERGYLLTGQEKYLEPYEKAIEQFKPDFHKLRSLTMDNQDQQRALDKLMTLVTPKLDLLREGIALAQSGQQARALGVMKEGAGETLMADIRALIAQFCRTEFELLNVREDAESRARNILLFLILGSLTGASVLAVMALDVQRRLIRNLQFEAKQEGSCRSHVAAIPKDGSGRAADRRRRTRLQ